MRTFFLKRTIFGLIIFSTKYLKSFHQVELSYNPKAILGEGPVWHRGEQKLYWVDIEGYAVHVFHPGSQTTNKIDFEKMPGALVPMESGGLLIAFEDGLAVVDLETSQIDYKIKFTPDDPDIRCNDGKCDPNGNFWIGTMHKKFKPEAGSLHKVDYDYNISKQIDRTTISNGLAWSTDSQTMYYIDTPTACVTAYEFRPSTSQIFNPRRIINIPESYGAPDGMTIDEEGMLWISHWNGSCVRRWDPSSGKVLAKVDLPVPLVTCCTFGGAKLDVLYITTARSGLSNDQLQEYPLSGGLFAITPGICGLPTSFFKG